MKRSPRLVRWCAHPIRHSNYTKVGCKTNHPKRKGVMRQKLASFIQTRYRSSIGNAKIKIKEDDHLCTRYYNFENNKVDKKYGASQVSNEDIAEIVDGKNIQLDVDSNLDSVDEEMNLSINASASNSPIKYQSSQTQALNLLNAMFDLLSIDRIVDM